MGIFDWFSKRSAKKKSASGGSMRATGAHKAARPNAGASGVRRNSDRTLHSDLVQNAPSRNKFVREDTGTHETLKILDDSLLEQEEEAGADPYNTGRFDRSKSWNSSRSRN
jgi:hypothetical protein